MFGSLCSQDVRCASVRREPVRPAAPDLREGHATGDGQRRRGNNAAGAHLKHWITARQGVGIRHVPMYAPVRDGMPLKWLNDVIASPLFKVPCRSDRRCITIALRVGNAAGGATGERLRISVHLARSPGPARPACRQRHSVRDDAVATTVSSAKSIARQPRRCEFQLPATSSSLSAAHRALGAAILDRCFELRAHGTPERHEYAPHPADPAGRRAPNADAVEGLSRHKCAPSCRRGAMVLAAEALAIQQHGRHSLLCPRGTCDRDSPSRLASCSRRDRGATASWRSARRKVDELQRLVRIDLTLTMPLPRRRFSGQMPSPVPSTRFRIDHSATASHRPRLPE